MKLPDTIVRDIMDGHASYRSIALGFSAQSYLDLPAGTWGILLGADVWGFAPPVSYDDGRPITQLFEPNKYNLQQFRIWKDGAIFYDYTFKPTFHRVDQAGTEAAPVDAISWNADPYIIDCFVPWEGRLGTSVAVDAFADEDVVNRIISAGVIPITPDSPEYLTYGGQEVIDQITNPAPNDALNYSPLGQFATDYMGQPAPVTDGLKLPTKQPINPDEIDSDTYFPFWNLHFVVYRSDKPSTLF